MRKKILSFLLLLSITVISFSQTKDTEPGDLSLPDFMIIKNGNVKIKDGYTINLYKGEAVVTTLAKKRVEGTFICTCKSPTTGNKTCRLTISDRVLLCLGDCNCVLSVTINGIKYKIDYEGSRLIK